MSKASKWADLGPRLISALVMAIVGAAAIWLGGVWFLALVLLLAGLMMWELMSMLAPERGVQAVQMGLLSAAALMMAVMGPGMVVLPVLVAPGIVAASFLPQRKLIGFAYGVVILLSAYALVFLREGAGLGWLVWLVLVVIVTDVAGYFAGRFLGGPKFWPRVSPKKTWSGTAAGWVGAALVGALMMAPLGAGAGLIAVSVVMSFASQMGDIAESAIKRLCGIKDSSNLIPGHGGVLDRFDGMLGAALITLLVSLVRGMPMGAG